MHIQEEERPGQEILERIENTSYLLGRSHQIRPTILQLLQHFQYTGTNIGMSTVYGLTITLSLIFPFLFAALNVECQNQSNIGYEHVFQGGMYMYM